MAEIQDKFMNMHDCCVDSFVGKKRKNKPKRVSERPEMGQGGVMIAVSTLP